MYVCLAFKPAVPAACCGSCYRWLIIPAVPAVTARLSHSVCWCCHRGYNVITSTTSSCPSRLQHRSQSRASIITGSSQSAWSAGMMSNSLTDESWLLWWTLIVACSCWVNCQCDWLIDWLIYLFIYWFVRSFIHQHLPLIDWKWKNKKAVVCLRWIGTTVFCRILSWATEFAHFYRIAEFGTRRWYRGQIWHILVQFCMYTWFHHEIHDCHSSSDGRNRGMLKI